MLSVVDALVKSGVIMVERNVKDTKLNESEYKHLIAYELDNNNTPDALKIAKQALSEYPEAPELNYLSGTIYADLGMYEEAKQLLNSSIDGLSNPFPAIFQLGLLFFTSGQFEQAEDTWNKLQSLPEDHYFLKFSRGFLAILADKYQQAIQFIEQGIDLNSELPALNHDMKNVIERIQGLEGDTDSFSHVLLSEYQK